MSSSSKAVQEHKDSDQSYDLGELELAPRPAPRTPDGPGTPASHELDLPTLSEFHGAHPANDAALRHEEHDQDQFDPLADDDERRLELDLPHDDPVIARSAPARTPSVSDPSAARAPLRPSTPQEEELAARHLSGFGDPPLGLTGAAGYVLHVIRRSFALRQERTALEVRAGELRDQHDAALGALGRLLLDELRASSHPALTDPIARIQTAEAELAQRREAATAARTRQNAHVHALDERRTAIESQLAPYLAAERKAASDHQRAEAELKRKRAQQKRLEIELRALEKATVPAPPARRTQLQSELDTRTSELDALVAAHTEAESALGVARRELALRRGSLDAAEREQAQQRNETRALSGRLDADVATAEEGLARTLRGLAEIALAQGLAGSHPEAVAAVASKERALDELVARLATYDRALGRYDRATLMRGVLIWLTLAAVVVFVLLSL